MKPILVNNQSEWLLLAPVLEALGYFWRGSISILSFTPLVFPCTITIIGGTITWSTYSCHAKYDTQSVDEYLASQEHKWETEAIVTINLAPDYQALYEAEKAKNEKLTQGVKDAKAEMEATEYIFARSGNNYEEDKAKGLELAIEILTEKTRV